MKKNKKALMTATGLVVGLVAFGTTAFVALANNSVYEDYKKAILNFIGKDNYSAEVKLNFKSQDKEIASTEGIYIVDKDDYYISNIEENIDGYKYNSASYLKDKNYIRYQDDKIVFEETRDYVSRGDVFRKKMTENEKKFFNVLMDTILGDTKNSIVADNKRLYADLEEHQIPALMQSGFAVVAESMKNDFNSYDNSENEYLRELMNLNNLTIKNVKGSGEIDEQGNLKSFEAAVEIGGYTSSKEYKSFSMDFSSKFYDIGTTKVVKPDIEERAEVMDTERNNENITIEVDGKEIEVTSDMINENLITITE